MDRDIVRRFMGEMMGWIGGAVNVGVLGICDRIGLFAAMQPGEAMTAADVAAATGADPRYIEELLAACAASGILTLDGDRFTLPGEHAVVLTDATSPYYMAGWGWTVPAMLAMVPAVAEAVELGTGVDGAEYPDDVVAGTDMMNGPAIRALFVRKWLPAMPDVVAGLETGVRVADIGCGLGAAALSIAAAFPNCEVVGYDVHRDSVESARLIAEERSIENARFVAIDATDLPTDPPFDFVVSFDAIHDMGNAPDVLIRIRQALGPGGTYLMVEPNVGPTIESNLNPLGAMFYGISSLYCLPISRASGDAALGTAWGPQRAEEMARAAGFGTFERLPIDNPTNAFYRLGV